MCRGLRGDGRSLVGGCRPCQRAEHAERRAAWAPCGRGAPLRGKFVIAGGAWESSLVTTTGMNGVRRPVDLAAVVLAGVALASLWRGAGPITLLAGGLIGASCAVWGSRFSSPHTDFQAPRVDLIERVAPLLPLVCLVPVLTLTVAPGADMAMHVAMGRGLRAGATELSPAWPAVAP